MKPLDFFKSFNAHKSETEAALTAHTQAIEARDKQISDLTATLEAIEATSKTKAEDVPADDDTSSEEDDLINELQQVLDKYKNDEDSGSSDSADDKSSDSDSSDSGDDDSSDDDANDESAKAKATKVEKLKASVKAVSKIVAATKKVKASVAKQVIREIAAVGIPTAIATKPEGKTSDLKGIDRVSAAFAEQLTPNK